MATVRKAKILRNDQQLWDGVNKTSTRVDSTGGNLTGVKVGDSVDVLMVYGNGTDYTSASINSALSKIPSSTNCSFLFATGTWSITADVTIPSNITSIIPAGCVFDVDSGITLTINGHIHTENSTWSSGSGTVTFGGSSGSGAVLANTSNAAQGDALVGVDNTATNTTATTQHNVNENVIRGVLTFYAGNGDGTTDDRTAINNANTDGPFRLESGNYRVATNLTISQDIYFDPGAILEPDSGVTVTITGAINAGDYQIFGDAGDISFSGGTVQNASPMWFGVTGDGSTDDYTALLRMRDTLRTTNGCTLTFPPKNYVYSGSFWIKGIKNLVINAHGATFKNTQAGGTGSNIDSVGLAINLNAFDDVGYDDTAWPGDNHTFGYLIDTVAAGGSSVTTSTATDAGNFSAGDKVIVYGYGQQSSSYPPNPRYFEYKTVSSADSGTGVVTFDEVLQNRYRSDWWDFSTGKGASRIINMSRAAYDLGDYLEWNGGEFLVNTSWNPGGEVLNGKVQVEGYRTAVFNGVIMPGFVPSVVERVECNHCTINGCELDKLITYVLLNGCEINHLTGGTGVNTLEMSGTKVIEAAQFLGHNLIVDGGEIHSEGASATTVQFGLSSTFHQNSIEFKGTAFNIHQSDWVGLINGGAELSVTAASAPTTSSITVTAASDAAAEDIVQSLHEGMEIRTASGGKSCIVTEVYMSAASTITIEGSFSSAPAISDVYLYPTIKSIKLANIREFGDYAPSREKIAFPRALKHRIEERDEKHFFLTYSQDDLPKPASAGATDDFEVFVRSTLKSVYVNVWSAAGGGDGANQLLIRNNDSGTTLETIDLQTTGARYMTEFANSGSAGADILANLSSNTMEELEIRATKGGGLFHTYADDTELPYFTVVLEFVRYR